jgi:hypothetical protein
MIKKVTPFYVKSLNLYEFLRGSGLMELEKSFPLRTPYKPIFHYSAWDASETSHKC